MGLLRQLLLQALRLLQDLRLLQLQALLLWPLRLQGILLSGELTLDGLPMISTTTKTKKHREEPLSEETLHKTKLTDNERRRTKKRKAISKVQTAMLIVSPSKMQCSHTILWVMK